MGYKELSAKYARIIQALEASRESEAMIMASDAHALTAARIQEEGKDWKGAQMPLYSQNELPLFFFNEANYNAPGKVKAFKDRAKAGKVKSSYHEFRKSYGLPVNKRTLTFDGNMFKDIAPKVTKKEKTSIECTVMAKSSENQDKVNWNSRMVKENILQFADAEKKLIGKLNMIRLKKAYESVK